MGSPTPMRCRPAARSTLTQTLISLLPGRWSKMDRIAEAIENSLPEVRPLGHHDPNVGHQECDAIKQALSDLNTDLWQHTLARKLAKYVGVNYVVPVVSGTAALHLALLAVGVKPGEEVLVPSLTFAATAAAVTHAGAIPHF